MPPPHLASPRTPLSHRQPSPRQPLPQPCHPSRSGGSAFPTKQHHTCGQHPGTGQRSPHLHEAVFAATAAPQPHRPGNPGPPGPKARARRTMRRVVCGCLLPRSASVGSDAIRQPNNPVVGHHRNLFVFSATPRRVSNEAWSTEASEAYLFFIAALTNGFLAA